MAIWMKIITCTKHPEETRRLMDIIISRRRDFRSMGYTIFERSSSLLAVNFDKLKKLPPYTVRFKEETIWAPMPIATILLRFLREENVEFSDEAREFPSKESAHREFENAA